MSRQPPRRSPELAKTKVNELAEFGFYIFAAKSRRAFRFGLDPAPMAFDFATVLALRHDNPSILKLPTGDEVAATMQTEPLRDRHFQEEIGRRGDIKE